MKYACRISAELGADRFNSGSYVVVSGMAAFKAKAQKADVTDGRHGKGGYR